MISSNTKFKNKTNLKTINFIIGNLFFLKYEILFLQSLFFLFFKTFKNIYANRKNLASLLGGMSHSQPLPEAWEIEGPAWHLSYFKTTLFLIDIYIYTI